MPRNRAPTGGFGYVHVRPLDIIEFDPSDYSVEEADTTITVTVVRIGRGIGQASVNYATQNDTAVSAIDYIAAFGTLTWAHGETGPKTIDIDILADSDTEGDEDFFINLSAPVNAQLGTAQATVVIVDAPVTDTCPQMVDAIFGDGTSIVEGDLTALPAAGETASRANAGFALWNYDISVNAINPCAFITNTASADDTVTP